jgi:hypothetical protein
MQPVIERRPNGEDTPTRTRLGFQDDDPRAGLVKEISGAQACETGADDDYGLTGIERLRGDASNGGCGERNPTRDALKKSSAIHAVRTSRRRAVGDRGIMARDFWKCQEGATNKVKGTEARCLCA